MQFSAAQKTDIHLGKVGDQAEKGDALSSTALTHDWIRQIRAINKALLWHEKYFLLF